MVLKASSAARWTIAATLFVAGSCAPVSQGSLARPDAPYDVGLAERTFVFGYSTIAERHLDRVKVAEVALEGMKGLASIDPEVGFRREGDRVLLSASDRVVAEYPAPGDDDSAAWARLTVTAALDARAISKAMHDADSEMVHEAVFDATLAKLDMFSRYSGAKEAREHRASRNGFGGLGLRFEIEGGRPKLIEVMDGTPAKEAGLQVGDRVTHVDGEPIAGLDRAEISKRLRGPVASSVSLLIERAAVPVEVSLRRALIVPPTVTASVDDGIATFRVSSFNQRTAASLAAEIRSVRAQHGDHLSGVMLDLRGNPGGLLDQAVTMADLFVADGPIVSTRGRHPLASQSYEARDGDIAEDLPVVVLVDGKSASAAEILASALQDAGRAVVVGTNSYGKGTVQTVVRMPNDGEMTLTWSRFHTPSGYALHGLGVLPTICTADEKATPSGLMEGVIHASLTSPVTANLQAWRALAIEEVDARKKLRATCPSAKHADVKIDIEMARSLLKDGTLYARALSLSAPLQPPSSAGLPQPARMPQQVEH